MDSGTMKNRVIITGSWGLIGDELVERFQHLRYNVVEADLRYGDDLLDESFCKTFFKENEADGLIHCAGRNDHVTGDRKPSILDISSDSFTEFMIDNVTMPFIVGREYARNNSHGSVIYFGSLYSLVAPSPGISPNKHPGYTASKHGLIGLTKHMAVNFAPIRFNCICPGGIDYNQGDEFKARYNSRVPIGRMANVSDLINPILMLLNSPYITGAILPIDGGYTIL